MNLHLIAIGGSIMHNLALDLHFNGHTVTGSDDEIYDPAKSRLQQAGLYPKQLGWNESSIHSGLDAVIVGKHARKDNPELKKAVSLGLKVFSFPSFVAEMSVNKKRIVIAGSHGKTTTTSMVMHVAKHAELDFDYLVGAQLDGFERMVKLSEAPYIIIEGDEYLTSPLDDRPKFLHYKASAAVITGIAWDHMNVFPTLDNYEYQFRRFIESTEDSAYIYYYAGDPALVELANHFPENKTKAYKGFKSKKIEEGSLVLIDGEQVKVPFFGNHNMQNLEAAYYLCKEMGISDNIFIEAIQTFKGPAKRMQKLLDKSSHRVYQDFAHAPSKVKATLEAFVRQFEYEKIVACLELHTYSSLNKAFLPQYKGSLDGADIAIVLYDPHALKMKRMPDLSKEEVKAVFGAHVLVFNDPKDFAHYLEALDKTNTCFLMMSSGPWGGLNLKEVLE